METNKKQEEAKGKKWKLAKADLHLCCNGTDVTLIITPLFGDEGGVRVWVSPQAQTRFGRWPTIITNISSAFSD